ncbi:decapping and exoribonuclease protein isoform X2 [Peromyscus californicus insignis]|uniref:decapping and exoribonuclease protein isoform X2 n=1 Tax=Peromyscus californicus insignis TaxID=564181 RepID=UPI0022A6F489|nr:decapping and exoribonuclease protein isoform X2 [Peromyscus californicus insignis]
MEMPEPSATTAHPPSTVQARTLTSEMDTLIDTSPGMRKSKRGWTICYAGFWNTDTSWGERGTTVSPKLSPLRGPGWLAGATVTWRGHLTKLLTTPYERQEGWQLAASRFQGTLYLSEVETPAARAQRLARPPLLRELMYMGYKFEQYMCADKPGGPPDPSGEVNTNVAFCSVLRSRLGNHPLLFSGEVDCTDPQAPSTQPPACYVELKTSKEMHSPGQWRSFYRHKLLKWWAQSFLPGVPHVVAGFRNPEGFVCSLKTFSTMEMFENVRNDREGWNPSVCMNFCAAFLSFAQSTVVQDDPRLVHLFSWEPGGPVTVSVHRDAPYAFLPTWYVEAMTQDPPALSKTPSPKD